jgi:hypothetical protein
MSWTRRLGAFRRLSAAERRVVAEAVTTFLCVAIAIRLTSVRRVRAAGERMRAGNSFLPALAEPARAARLAELVAATARALPVRPACLTRSLALQRILGRRGIASTLRLGVRKVGTKLEAHAWLERAGSALAEPASQRTFAAFEADNR